MTGKFDLKKASDSFGATQGQAFVRLQTDVVLQPALALPRARLAALYPGEHRIESEEADGRVRVLVELPARLGAKVAS